MRAPLDAGGNECGASRTAVSLAFALLIGLTVGWSLGGCAVTWTPLEVDNVCDVRLVREGDTTQVTGMIENPNRVEAEMVKIQLAVIDTEGRWKKGRALNAIIPPRTIDGWSVDAPEGDWHRALTSIEEAEGGGANSPNVRSHRPSSTIRRWDARNDSALRVVAAHDSTGSRHMTKLCCAPSRG